MHYSGFFIARLEAGLHARDVAEALDKTPDYILAIEASELLPPDEILTKLCQIYGKDADYLKNLQLFPYVKYMK